MKKWMSIVAAVMLVAVLAACSGGSAPANTPAASSDTPESVASAFFQASFAGDIETAKNYVCAAMASEISDEAAAAMAAMAEAKMDFSGVTFTASDVTDTSATVTASGTLKVEMAGVTQELNFADMGPGASVPLVKENGAWKVCQPTGS